MEKTPDITALFRSPKPLKSVTQCEHDQIVVTTPWGGLVINVTDPNLLGYFEEGSTYKITIDKQ